MFKAKEKGYCGADSNSGISFPSAEKIAYGYGLKFIKIDNIIDLDSKIMEAYNSQGPLVCEIVTDPNEQFQPKLQSKLLEDGKFSTPSLEDMYPFLSENEMKENVFKQNET
jgi:acetolactate synthase-1/2/3 large subunit